MLKYSVKTVELEVDLVLHEWLSTGINSLPTKYLRVQSQQWKHQNNKRNMFKVNNRDTRMISLTSSWCRYCQFWTKFPHYSCISIIDFEQVNTSSVVIEANEIEIKNHLL